MPLPSGDDRQCASVARMLGQRPQRSRCASSTTPGVVVVVDNLPDDVPVSAAELDVIETYLDDALREVLGGDKVP